MKVQGLQNTQAPRVPRTNHTLGDSPDGKAIAPMGVTEAYIPVESFNVSLCCVHRGTHPMREVAFTQLDGRRHSEVVIELPLTVEGNLPFIQAKHFFYRVKLA
tara:strand:- start:181 stop:489 length:309 start_codon:yes stop_codon:yes gene_type:complete